MRVVDHKKCKRSRARSALVRGRLPMHSHGKKEEELNERERKGREKSCVGVIWGVAQYGARMPWHF